MAGVWGRRQSWSFGGSIRAAGQEPKRVGFRGFFQQNLRTTIDPPVGILLAQFGVRLHLRSAENEADGGGCRGLREERPRAWLGLQVKFSDNRVRVSHVVAGGPGQLAGLVVGDEVVAIGGRRIDPENWEPMIDGMTPGGDQVVQIFRDQALLQLSCQPAVAPAILVTSLWIQTQTRRR